MLDKKTKYFAQNAQDACYNKNMIAKFFDDFLLAGKGILLAARTLRFWIVFLISFIVFGTLMFLLSDGFSAFSLMGSMGFPACLKVPLDAMLSLFVIKTSFLDWFVIFFVALLQSILIAMIAVTMNVKKRGKKETTSENVERAGIAAGLAILGSGCPTCGTALLTPVLGAIFAGSSALIGAISSLITILAVIIILLSLKKVGTECYCLIVSEKYQKKRGEKHEKMA